MEGVNTPRQRAVEAQKLMKYFNEFLDGELKSDVFTNPEKVSIVKRNSQILIILPCIFKKIYFYVGDAHTCAQLPCIFRKLQLVYKC